VETPIRGGYLPRNGKSISSKNEKFGNIIPEDLFDLSATDDDIFSLSERKIIPKYQHLRAFMIFK
jgi:hypothetical protein